MLDIFILGWHLVRWKKCDLGKMLLNVAALHLSHDMGICYQNKFIF